MISHNDSHKCAHSLMYMQLSYAQGTLRLTNTSTDTLIPTD